MEVKSVNSEANARHWLGILAYAKCACSAQGLTNLGAVLDKWNDVLLELLPYAVTMDRLLADAERRGGLTHEDILKLQAIQELVTPLAVKEAEARNTALCGLMQAGGLWPEEGGKEDE